MKQEIATARNAVKPKFRLPAVTVEKPAPTRKREFLVLAVTILSLFGTVLTLIGYGVAVSVDDVFGVPHESLFSSPFELLDLSVWAFLRFMSGLNANLNFWTHYSSVLKQLMPAAVGMFVGICIFATFVKSKHGIDRVRNSAPAWLSKLIRQPAPTDSWWLLIVKGSFLGAASLLVVSLALVVFFFVCVLLIAFLAVPPAIGMTAGGAHIKEYVIDPLQCSPLRNREARMQSKEVLAKTEEVFAKCVRVSNDRRLLGMGRVVFVTSSALILFDPASGAVWRVPTKDAVIEKIALLEGDVHPKLPENVSGEPEVVVKKGSAPKTRAK